MKELRVLCMVACWSGILQGMVRGEAGVDAAGLVREVRAGEKWFEEVRSFRVAGETVWTKSQQAIGADREDLQKRFPEMEITTKAFPELLERSTSTIEMAFSADRFYFHTHQPLSADDTWLWDGERALTHTVYYSHSQEEYSIRRDKDVGEMEPNWFAWPLGDTHVMWWDEKRAKEMLKERPKAEDFAYLRNETVEGIECYVLGVRGVNLQRWSVGAKDHLLHRVEVGSLATAKAILAAYSEEAEEHGVSLTTQEELTKWLKGLPRAEQDRVSDAALTTVNATAIAPIQSFMGDYREVKAGCWYPFKQGSLLLGYRLQKDGKPVREDWEHPWVRNQTETRIVSLELDKALPQEMFRMEMKEGASVWDETYDSPMSYKYKKDRTPAEWEEMVNNARAARDRDKAVEAAEDAMIGTAAPAFGAGVWINSDGLTWEKLRGRPVVLDFFSEWCGPCRNDLPVAEGVYEGREKNGVTIIGIHTAGSKREAIDKVMGEFKMHYPVYVDVGTEAAWGELFKAYHLDHIPHAVLVDCEGKVAGHGGLGEMLRKGAGLAGGKKGGR
ncbi:MAG: TlpA family protein disulfide reductase [Phycisphaerae bacterium]